MSLVVSLLMVKQVQQNTKSVRFLAMVYFAKAIDAINNKTLFISLERVGNRSEKM